MSEGLKCDACDEYFKCLMNVEGSTDCCRKCVNDYFDALEEKAKIRDWFG